jgi:hypothetical protein
MPERKRNHERSDKDGKPGKLQLPEQKKEANDSERSPKSVSEPETEIRNPEDLYEKCFNIDMQTFPAGVVGIKYSILSRLVGVQRIDPVIGFVIVDSGRDHFQLPETEKDADCND